ncbi:MAG: fibronectin type III domain-containing protein [Muribaculaceae bacterium]
MKANLYSIVLMAGAMISSANAFAQPTTSAPTPPELAKSKVISIYSDAYASTGFDFGVWGSGTTYALEKIGDTDNVAKFTTTDLGYFGWEFSKVNTAAMDKLHVDVYGDAAFSVRVVPITGGAEVGQTIEVSAGKWTSVDLDTKVFADGGANLANVYQIKFDNVKSQTFYIDNVYFWSTSTDVDTEAPAWVSEPTAVANSTSATISVNAKDNVSTTLTYEVSKTADFATLEATVNGKANETTEIALKGLSPKTDYTYYVRVKDMAGNVGDVKTVTFTTTAQAAVVATYYGVFYPNDWEEKATVGGKEMTPQINWKAETLEGYNDVIVTAELSEALPDGAALKFCAVIDNVGQVDNKVMAATGKANEYTIKLSEVLPEGKTLEKDLAFGQFFFRLFPKGEGAFSRTKILTTYKVGASNDPIATDTKAPEWGVDPVVEKVTDKTAEIVVNVTDDSGIAVITLTGDNGFAELKKEVKADGSNQTIVLNGLTANTTYNLTLAIADAAGNAGESRTVNFTTLETPDREVLYHSFDFTSKNWTKHEHVGSNTFAPNGRLLLTVNADNTVTFKVTVDEGAETVDNAWVILHEIDSFMINAQEDGSFVGTSTKSISNREAPQAFHLNFVLKNGVGNSELDVMYFTPSEGSTSAVAEVETEVAKVVAANGVIRVEGDKTFAVYTVAGQLAFRGMGEVRLDKGVYVVVVDGKAQKVML